MASAILAKLVYSTIPSQPTLTPSPVTLTAADQYAAGFMNKTKFPLGTAVFSGAFPDGLNIRDPASFAITNAVGATFGNTTLGAQHGFTTNTSNPSDGKVYGTTPAAPFYVQSQPQGTGGAQNGFQLASGASANWLLQNCVIDGSGASGVTANFGGGTFSYGTLTFDHVRSFSPGQEGFYLGNTGGSPDRINTINVTNCFAYFTGRESIQVKATVNCTINHFTGYYTGQNGLGGQNYGRQWQDCLGVSANNIFMFADGPAFNLATHGSTFRNEYYSFYGNGGVTYSFIGRTDIVYAGSPCQNGQPVIFEYCHFEWLGAGNLPFLVQVEERTANIIFRNCTFSSNILAIYSDNRVAGFTNTLSGAIGGVGNNAYAVVAAPVISDTTATNFTTHGLVTNAVSFHRGWGYRTGGGMSIAA